VFGLGEDAGQYWRCHYCGWINDKRRDAQAFAGGEPGDFHNTTTALTGVTYSYNSKILVDFDNESVVLPKLDAAGDAVPAYHVYTLDFSGCPLCGTRNIKT